MADRDSRSLLPVPAPDDVRQRSAKAAATHRARIDRLKRTTHGPERCQWPTGCTEEAVDAHERLNRSQGGDPTDPDDLLCRRHHDWITSNPIGARVLELSHPRWVHDRMSDMPPPNPDNAEAKVSFRMKQSGRDWLEQLKAETGRPLSAVVRASFEVAAMHRREVVSRLHATTRGSTE